ncbi:HAD-IA family hydrolase [Moritella sp. 36]|uniref:HAD-IA family hydrolase n=1 Tax=Moritella sp. 36 TaxID=2746233 RepID=UPI001BAACEBE|nr:HAD-IA family hydrolase [Moritella sp. 36]QUM89792.1 HAD-IA family hydrolase [Moritella sp. 36]
MKKCLLFDCDGTLVDSERLCNQGFVIKFAELGIKLDVDLLMLNYRGWELDKILADLSCEFDVRLPNDFAAKYRVVVAELFESELRPIEGIKAALDLLPYPKAVVSNGPIFKIKQALELCGLSDYFGSHIYSAYDIGIWKPDPRIYEFAAKDMGFDSKDCIVIEDGLVGVEAGYKAGMQTLFYNRFNQTCVFSSVVSFNAMVELPGLINAS